MKILNLLIHIITIIKWLIKAWKDKKIITIKIMNITLIFVNNKYKKE